MRIDQLLSGYADGDAISREARELRRLLHKMGYASDIYTDLRNTSETLRSDCIDAGDYTGSAENILINHYALGSSVDRVWEESVSRGVLRYHNITPAEYFKGYDDALASRLEEGREGLQRAAARSAVCWPVSAYNAEELAKPGMTTPVKVLPLIFDPESLQQDADPTICSRFNDDLTTVLFVGRMVPNKRIEDLISMFAWYHQTLNDQSRLILVGSPDSCPRYYAFCRMLASEFGLANVCFEGFRSESELCAYYRCADAFVSTSVHEGYCLPLIEAMMHDAVVIAHDRGGMPEAMGGAGVLYEGLEHVELAALLHEVLQPGQRDTILAEQRQRVTRLGKRNVEEELTQLIAAIGP